MRFLVSPNTDEFMDRNSLWGLVHALRQAGHEAIFPTRPLDGFEAAPLCERLGVDVVFALNRARPYDLPANIRHIAWFQDQPAIPEDLADRVRPTDIVYRILPPRPHEPDVNGRCLSSYLYLAMDEMSIDAHVPPKEQSIDFSFCGTMVAPLVSRSMAAPLIAPDGSIWQLLQRIYGTVGMRSTAVRGLVREIKRSWASGSVLKPDVHLAMIATAELINRPLEGDWDPNEIEQGIRDIALSRVRNVSPRLEAMLDRMVQGYAIEIPRMMDRLLLVENMLQITDSVELYGVNWDKHPLFAPYHRGVVTGPHALFSIYGRSRLNGANTLRSILHRRTLECMAVGGFVFINSCVNDSEPGGLRTFFEPGVHYGDYRPDNIREEAARWLKDEGLRQQVARQGALAIREKHLWRHRVDQILKDLASV